MFATVVTSHVAIIRSLPVEMDTSGQKFHNGQIVLVSPYVEIVWNIPSASQQQQGTKKAKVTLSMIIMAESIDARIMSTWFKLSTTCKSTQQEHAMTTLFICFNGLIIEFSVFQNGWQHAFLLVFFWWLPVRFFTPDQEFIALFHRGVGIFSYQHT